MMNPLKRSRVMRLFARLSLKIAPFVAGPPRGRGPPPAGAPRGTGGAQQDAEGGQRRAQETTPEPRICGGRRQRGSDSHSRRWRDWEEGESSPSFKALNCQRRASMVVSHATLRLRKSTQVTRFRSCKLLDCEVSGDKLLLIYFCSCSYKSYRLQPLYKKCCLVSQVHYR